MLFKKKGAEAPFWLVMNTRRTTKESQVLFQFVSEIIENFFETFSTSQQGIL